MNMLTLFISLRCNQSCAHCLYGCSPDHGEHMSFDVFKRAMSLASENGIPVLNFFGGEPLLNPDFFAMLEESLERGFSLLLATNCRLLEDHGYYAKFLKTAGNHKNKITIITAKDKFHLRYFNPAGVIEKLRQDGYEVIVNDYSDDTVLLTEFNGNNDEVSVLNTGFCCCGHKQSDDLGVLPNGGWTICPPSLVQFGDIFSVELSDIVAFKNGLSLRCMDGCSECLKDFQRYRREFSRYVRMGI